MTVRTERHFRYETIREELDACLAGPAKLPRARELLANASREAKRAALMARLDAEGAPHDVLLAQISTRMAAEVTFLKAVAQLYASELAPRAKVLASHRVSHRSKKNRHRGETT